WGEPENRARMREAPSLAARVGFTERDRGLWPVREGSQVTVPTDYLNHLILSVSTQRLVRRECRSRCGLRAINAKSYRHTAFANGYARPTLPPRNASEGLPPPIFGMAEDNNRPSRELIYHERRLGVEISGVEGPNSRLSTAPCGRVLALAACMAV